MQSYVAGNASKQHPHLALRQPHGFVSETHAKPNGLVRLIHNRAHYITLTASISKATRTSFGTGRADAIHFQASAICFAVAARIWTW